MRRFEVIFQSLVGRMRKRIAFATRAIDPRNNLTELY